MIEIYTDMSVFNVPNYVPNSFGYAWFKIDEEDNETLFAENVLFESQDLIKPHQYKNTNLIEEYAILQALIAVRQNPINSNEIVVYTDCENFFNIYHGLFNPHKKKNREKAQDNKIVPAIKHQIKLLKKRRINVDIRCIKGHKNVYGNACVNNYSKKHNLSRFERVQRHAYNIYLTTKNTNEEDNWLQAEKNEKLGDSSYQFKLAKDYKNWYQPKDLTIED